MADLLTNLAAAAGAAGGENLYIEDVFSTYLYVGNGSTQTITNGIDLDGEGGLVWAKERSNTGTYHQLRDTVRGGNKEIYSNDTSAQGTSSAAYTFLSSGYSIGGNDDINLNTKTYASWTFRKAPKFFDVVTYTGTGANRTVAHNLGSVPGCIMVKRTDTTGNWQVYHRANTANPETDFLILNTTAATADSNTRWNDTAPTSAVFSLGTEATVNASGGTYVAYLWAHDDGGFGDDGLQNVVSCGSFTADGSGNASVTLGYEPQWILIKSSSGADNWWIIDNMRGITGAAVARLFPNLSNAEQNTTAAYNTTLTPTGFSLANFSGGISYIYIAIRRGPMRTPTAGTEVLGLSARSGTGANATVTGSAGVSDAVLVKNRGSAVASLFSSRLTGTGYLVTSTQAEEVAAGTTILQANPWDVMDGVKVGTTSTITNASGNTFINYLFSRAPGFFDVVCYTGTGSARTVAHNLGVVPELMIIKSRSNGAQHWYVYLAAIWGTGIGGTADYDGLRLNSNAAAGQNNATLNSTQPTASVFSLGTLANANESGATFVNYLFASLAGVSKVGSYTGNGTSVSVTTGFQPRFILVKRADSTGNWIVGDSARGLVAGDDPYLLLNSTAAEDTDEDWVDVSATGFTINETAANANVNTGTYIYLCVS